MNKLILTVSALSLAINVFAEEPIAGNSIRSVTPAPRSYEECSWYTNWCENLEDELNKHPNEYTVGFIGDSITHGWNSDGKRIWDEVLSKPPYNAIMLGLSGDRTEGTLWRLSRGILTNQTLKAVVVMIGTNNTGHKNIVDEPPIDTILGIAEVVRALRERQPQAKIILHPIFPRGNEPDNLTRVRNDVVSKELKYLADNHNVWFVDFNDRFLTSDGHLINEYFRDGTHLSREGFEIWLNELLPYLNLAIKGDDGFATPMKLGRYDHQNRDFIDGNGVNHALLYGQFPARENRIRALRSEIISLRDMDVDLVLMGDSITEGWAGAGKTEYAKLREGRRILNIAWGGTGFQQNLWFARWGGMLTGYNAKRVAIMLGTNNSNGSENEEQRISSANVIFESMKLLVAEVREKQPQAKITIQSILPRGDVNRTDCIARVNTLVRDWTEKEGLDYLDLWPLFRNDDGTQKKELFAKDGIHLTSAGYAIWRDTLECLAK